MVCVDTSGACPSCFTASVVRIDCQILARAPPNCYDQRPGLKRMNPLGDGWQTLLRQIPLEELRTHLILSNLANAAIQGEAEVAAKRLPRANVGFRCNGHIRRVTRKLLTASREPMGAEAAVGRCLPLPLTRALIPTATVAHGAAC